jgi:hypothetical protein
MIASVVTGLHVPAILSRDVAGRPPSLLVGPEQVRVRRYKMMRQRHPTPRPCMIDDDKSLLHISGLNDDVTSAADDQAPAILHHGYPELRCL